MNKGIEHQTLTGDFGQPV